MSRKRHLGDLEPDPGCSLATEIAEDSHAVPSLQKVRLARDRDLHEETERIKRIEDRRTDNAGGMSGCKTFRQSAQAIQVDQVRR